MPSRLVGATRITGLRAPALERATFRLRFADGTTLKGRRLDRPAEAERIQRLIRHLDPDAFAHPLAMRGRALLEPWVDGKVLPRGVRDAEVIRACGALLGSVHAVRTDWDADEAARWEPARRLANVTHRLVKLAAAGLMSPRLSDRLIQVAGESVPSEIVVGIVHRDMWPLNIVIDSAGRPRVIDNGTISFGAHAFDLARTAYLWPMDAGARKAFRSGYDGAAPGRPADSPFWDIDVAAEVALFRHTAGVAGVPRPLAQLRRLASTA